MKEYRAKEIKEIEKNPYTFKVTPYKVYFTAPFENTFLKLKRWRGIATRYAKTTSSFSGAVWLASIFIWLNSPFLILRLYPLNEWPNVGFCHMIT